MRSGTFSLFVFFLFLLVHHSCSLNNSKVRVAQQWKELELIFNAEVDYTNPYTDVDFLVEFYHSNGDTIVRPGFWDNGNTWRVRFASSVDTGEWSWKSFSSNSDDQGLNKQKGKIICEPYSGRNQLIRHGLLKMSEGKRNVVHADGTSFLMIGDTPWALPWRGTYESVSEYARNRKEMGFNAALLMSLQPDQGVDGPGERSVEGGFGVAFEDLKQGHINHINIDYFQTLDSLIDILVDHGIVPVYQPVFHGFGWKGKDVLGWTIDPEEYARYTRYLIARYGAMPAMWLVGADGNGKNNGVAEGGMETEAWDAYQQPAGIHYNPFDDYSPEFMPESSCFHYNMSFQDANWLDFQWCQTGHNGEHLFHKVEKMYHNLPVKAVANGEPTYEGIHEPSYGSGWWQGHEAWSQFLSGGTMGVVYGAGGLWNWKLTPHEEGWPDWADSHVSWHEAIELPGSTFVGYLGKALKGIDITDIEKHPELAEENLCLAKPGKVYIVYLPTGGKVKVSHLLDSLTYGWFDPVEGEFKSDGRVNSATQEFFSGGESPMVLIIK
ncbi:MAG: DUF4038 domain-containing protein [Bacteroidota bacterium]